jgi:hypothetical protein
MTKPLPILVLSVLAALNGGVAFGLGMMTILGSKMLFTPSGYGPNRIAISQLFGPFADQTGWILLALGALFIVGGYGLFTLREWARLAVFWGFAVLAASTLVAVGWGVLQGQMGVAVGGLLKIVVEVSLCWYLATPSVRSSFSQACGGRKPQMRGLIAEPRSSRHPQQK